MVLDRRGTIPARRVEKQSRGSCRTSGRESSRGYDGRSPRLRRAVSFDAVLTRLRRKATADGAKSGSTGIGVALSSEIQEASQPEASPAPQTEGKRRRRGRRGGRNRRTAHAANGSAGQVKDHTRKTQEPAETPAEAVEAPEEAASPRMMFSQATQGLPLDSLGDTAEPSLKGRYGDPGLSSRLSLLEMQFRRLLACPPAKLSDADRAPAGPGVSVLTDSDLTTYYYVEVCQTLRIAVGNLLRGGHRRGTDSIKPGLAEHLGIPEARVAKYLADHCVVRWLQLDEGASNLAHFAIAVLRPILNE